MFVVFYENVAGRVVGLQMEGAGFGVFSVSNYF
jgi:hypothetical protein